MLLAVQSCTTVHVTPSNTHHLYAYGDVPPVPVAVNVIVVPGFCGAVLSAPRVVRVSGGGGVVAKAALGVGPTRSDKTPARPPPPRHTPTPQLAIRAAASEGRAQVSGRAAQ